MCYSITGKRYWFSSETGRKLVLPEHLRRDFSMKQITCIEYDSLNLDQERELFQRVQNGVALTPAGMSIIPISEYYTGVRLMRITHTHRTHASHLRPSA